MIRKIFLTMAIVGSITVAESARAQTITWNTAGAIIAGRGCQKNVDAFITINGNRLSVVLTNFGINLPRGVGTQLADFKSCSIVVPVSISPGYYVSNLTQTLSYGAIKTPGSSGSIAMLGTFFGFSVESHTWDFPYGTAINSPILVKNYVDPIAPNTALYRSWCSTFRPSSGLYRGIVVTTGQRANRNETLVLLNDGFDSRYDVTATLSRC